MYAVAQALRESAASTLGASGLTVHVTGAGGFFADFIIAFGGIDGILLLVALGVVFLILLIVYRSPILPFAVLISACSACPSRRSSSSPSPRTARSA